MARIKKNAEASEVIGFWTMILRDEGADLKDRLKVSEFLAKATGVFNERVSVLNEAGSYEKLTLEEKLALLDEVRRGK